MGSASWMRPPVSGAMIFPPKAISARVGCTVFWLAISKFDSVLELDKGIVVKVGRGVVVSVGLSAVAASSFCNVPFSSVAVAIVGSMFVSENGVKGMVVALA